MFAIRTILHPTDFSQPAAAAFRVARALAHDHEARLVVLHVLPPLLSDTSAAALEPVHDWEEQGAKMRRLCPADPRLRVEYRQVEDDPAAGILRVAGEQGCDLIVLGTHGRTGLARLLLGSVAEKTLRHAACPVLTVRALARADQAGEVAAPAEVAAR
jgi:nucleotide-binding universal stress UspA family protein